MDLETAVAGIKLEHPLMNAAGTCRTLEEVKELARSATAAVMVGSITWDERTGNEGDVFWNGPVYSLNSLGMPNRGGRYYRDVLPEMVRITHGEGKPLFVSVAGFNPGEYARLTEIAFEAGVDLVEENFGCPNVWDRGEQKRIVSFSPDVLEECLFLIEGKVGLRAKVSAKLSPFSDPASLAASAKVLSDSLMLKAVTSTNTFPNAFAFSGSKPRITPAGGLAGFAGPAMKPIGLGQVRQLRALLPEHIQIIGVGGITYGRDIVEYLHCGAVLTQTATAYLERGEVVFGELLSELLEAASHQK